MSKIKKLLKFTDDFENPEDLTLRDHLALARTKLANERTLFSYVRTSLYLLTAGISILEIKSIEHLKIIAYVSLFSSTLILLIGLLRFYQLKRHLRSYIPKNTKPKDITEN